MTVDATWNGEPTRLDFETDGGFGSRARIGLVVLAGDQTIEAEARRLNLDGVDWYQTRIEMDDEVTPETLTAMEARIPQAAALLPPAFGFDVIGYACTSAATLIGDDRVAAGIHTAHPGMATANPINSAIAAFSALGAKRLAIVTPYTAQVTAPVVARFTDAGFSVGAVGSFLESSDFTVARITEASVAAGVRQVADEADCDAIFVSCTSLRAFGIIAELEAELGKPVVSSNQALLWRLLRLAGVDDAIPGFGALLQTA